LSLFAPAYAEGFGLAGEKLKELLSRKRHEIEINYRQIQSFACVLIPLAYRERFCTN